MHCSLIVRWGNLHRRMGFAGGGATDEKGHCEPLPRHLLGHVHHFV